MATNAAENFKQSRMPDRPADIMADQGKGTRSKTPAMPSKACHIPDMAESVMAAKPGPRVDGLADYAGWGVLGMNNNNPVMAESFSKRKGS